MSTARISILESGIDSHIFDPSIESPSLLNKMENFWITPTNSYTEDLCKLSELQFYYLAS